MGAWLFDQRRVAAWTSPPRGLTGVRVLGLLLFLLLHLVGVPFLDAVEMGYRPADGTGPDTGGPHDFAGADDALVLAVVDIFVDTGGEVLGCGLDCFSGCRSGCPLSGLGCRLNRLAGDKLGGSGTQSSGS